VHRACLCFLFWATSNGLEPSGLLGEVSPLSLIRAHPHPSRTAPALPPVFIRAHSAPLDLHELIPLSPPHSHPRLRARLNQSKARLARAAPVPVTLAPSPATTRRRRGTGAAASRASPRGGRTHPEGEGVRLDLPSPARGGGSGTGGGGRRALLLGVPPSPSLRRARSCVARLVSSLPPAN
jgi:hypothetical protein